jgi:hypothetical protein
MSSAAEVVLPPSGARVIIEGGYYTIRPYPWKRGPLEGPRSFYVEVVAGTPPLPFELLRRPVVNDAEREWVVLTLPAGECVVLPEGLPSRRVMTFDRPTATELLSFNAAVEMAAALRSNRNRVSFALLVGDLALPPELRQPITWVLPDAYNEILTSRKDTVLLTESRCRAVAAKQIVRAAKRTLRNADALASLYGDAGCCVFDDATTKERAIYLAADALLDSRLTANPIVALTKDSTRPACAATIAGKLRALLNRERSLTYHIAWYDTADDPDIRNKNLEGLIVAASFFADVDVDAQVVTLDNGRITHIDRLKTSEVRKPGLRNGYHDLLLATHREGRHYGLEFILSASSVDCCVYHKTNA